MGGGLADVAKVHILDQNPPGVFHIDCTAKGQRLVMGLALLAIAIALDREIAKGQARITALMV